MSGNSIESKALDKTTLARGRNFARYATDKKAVLDVGLYFYNIHLAQEKPPGQILYDFGIKDYSKPPSYDHVVKGETHDSI